MKNLYSKGKGKIHPSPAVAAPPPPSSVGETASSPLALDALAVLKFLPAPILVLAAAMSCKDKEVLAYLITRSIHDHAAAMVPTAGTDRRRSKGPAAHRPTFDCGCFDCYTSFWSRWDCSLDHEVIHQVIEAFNEHLVSSEKKGVQVRRKDRRAVGKSEKGKEKKADEYRKLAEPEGPVQLLALPAELEKKSLEEPAGPDAAEASGTSDAAEEEAGGGGEEEAETAASGERRKGWLDMMGFVNSHFWSLWGPRV